MITSMQHSLNDKIIEMEDRLVVARSWGWGWGGEPEGKGMCFHEGNPRDVSGDACSISRLWWTYATDIIVQNSIHKHKG